MNRITLRRLVLAAAVTLVSASQSFAVLLYRTPTRNTTAPSGALADSGWQLQATFGGFVATPVAHNWFLTAAHVGAANQITLNGTTYNVDTSFVGSGPGYVDGPGTDLRLWKLQTSVPIWAQLWDESVDGTEVGKDLVVFGRGTPRQEPIYGLVGAPRDGGDTRVPAQELKGWAWKPYDLDDHVQSWGTNNVDSIIPGALTGLGDLVAFDFSRVSPLFDESALSAGDSGGGVFIKSGSTWKLAGINLAVDGPFRTRRTGTGFSASVFDMGGLFVGEDPRQFITDGSFDVPGSSYSTRISSNLAWIRSVIGPTVTPPLIPEPGSAVTLVSSGAMLLGKRRRRV